MLNKTNRQASASVSASAKAGFSLAEVVVAVLLFGLAAAVLGQSVSNALRGYAVSRQSQSNPVRLYEVRNHVLGLSNRSQIEAGGEIEIPVVRRREQGDTVETEMVRVRWEAEVFPTRLLHVFVLEVRVNFESGGEADRAEQRLIAYRPAWADSEEQGNLIDAKEEEFKERQETRGFNETEEGV